MKKRGMVALLVFCMTLGIAGCGQQKVKPVYTVSRTEADFEEQESGAGQGDVLRNGINHFAYDMYDELPEGENLFFSPYSLCTALSLLDVGAGTETKKELEELLGITNPDAWNQEMRAYLEKEWTDDTYVMTADSIWMQEGKEWSETIEEDFLVPAGYYYKSELYEADFKGNPKEAVSRMNAWADKNTKGMIQKVVDKLETDTAMALMNAVYFEGKWEKPFEAAKTYEQTFYGTDGDVQTTMMHQHGEYYAYAEADGIKGISLPYQDSSVVMKVFLPIEEDGDIEALFAALSYEEKEALLNSLDTAEKESIANLALPKFTMEKETEDLNEILQNMGMETAFSPDADFDSICEDLYVSQVLHKAKIEVDEEGTKAAAVTVVVTKDECAMPEENPIFFVADRPFLCVLQDTQTGMILFMGRINNL